MRKQCKRKVHQIEAHQAQHCVRGQVQWLGDASDAVASNSALRDHGEHCRRQTAKRRKRGRASRVPPHRPLWRVFVFDSNLKPSKTFKKNKLNILRHRLQSNTIVHTGTPVLKALRTTITLNKRRDGRHRLRDSALHGTTATVVHANWDKAMGFSPQGGELPKAHHGTRMASKRRRHNHRRIPGTHGWTASKATPGVFRRRDHAGQYRCRGNVIMTEGSNEAVQLGGFSLKEVE